MTPDPQPPRPILEQYDLDPDSIQHLNVGLINQSFAVRRSSGDECILQRVNGIFSTTVNDDIDAVTRHIHSKGLTTPLLIPSKAGNRYVTDDGQVWRLLSRIRGETHESVRTDTEATEAGRILGSFHQALNDFAEPLSSSRPPVHDLDRHLKFLRATAQAQDNHQALMDVTAVSEQIFEMEASMMPLPKTPDRLVHGDPKISNVIFDQRRAVCLIDLDTIGRTQVALELGDALRSWCNPVGEDSPEASFSIERFHAALQGYRRGAPGLLSTDEWNCVPDATLSIALELAARFAADALNESYFGWDPKRFSSASQHNLARASAQLELAKSIARQLPAMHEFIVTLM